MKNRILFLAFACLAVFMVETTVAAECPDEWRTLVGIGGENDGIEGCALVRCEVESDLVLYEFNCPFSDGPLRVLLAPNNLSSPAMSRSKSFNIIYQGRLDSADGVPDSIRVFLDNFTKRVTEGDKGNLKFTDSDEAVRYEKKTTDQPGAQEPDRWLGGLSKLNLPASQMVLIRNIELYAAGISLVLFFLLFLLRAPGFIYSMRTLLGWRVLLAVAAFSVLAFLIGLAAPQRMVMYYSGYGIINDSAAMYFGKYGAGASLLFNTMAALVRGGTENFIRFHMLLGVLTIPAAAFWLSMRLKNGSLAVIAAAIFALHPMFIKDRNSESILTACLFFFFWGSLFMEVWLTERKRLDGMAAFSAFAAALFTRPEFAVFVPLSVFVLHRNSYQNIKRCCSLATIIGWLLLTFIHLVWIALFIMSEWQWQPGAVWMPMQRNIIAVLLGPLLFFTHLDLFLLPNFTPLLLPLAAIAAFILSTKEQRIALLFLFFTSLLFFSFYFLDQPAPSRPRLQMPAQYFLCFISAAGFLAMYERARNLSPVLRRSLTGVFALLLLISFAVPHFFIWRSDNTVTEDEFMKEIPSLLPEREKSVLVVCRGDEKKEEGIFYDYPEYELKRGGDTEFYGVSKYRQTFASIKTPAYFYLGMCCYARLAWKNLEVENPPDYMNPECRGMLDEFALEPLKIWNVDNVDDGFGLYPASEKLKIGLYRIKGKK